MRLNCRLRDARGTRPLREIAEASGVQQAYLSQIELGRLLPKDDWLPGLVRAYGLDVDEWYPALESLALELARDGEM